MSAVAYGSDNNFRNLKQFLNDEFGVILDQDQERQGHYYHCMKTLQ